MSDNTLKLDRLKRYLLEFRDDSHISEAMCILNMTEGQVVRLAKELPRELLQLSNEFSKIHNHRSFKAEAIDFVRSKRLHPRAGVDILGYRFDVIGKDSQGGYAIAVECGSISDIKRCRRASKALLSVYHWPYGSSEPHKLGGCNGCKLKSRS